MEELDNVEQSAKQNNRAKCAEMVIHDSRRKRLLVMPSFLPDVARVQAMKVLGVTVSCSLSVSDHVNNISRSSAQSVHALRLFRAHGYGRLLNPHGIPSSYRSQANVGLCSKRLVGFYICRRPSAFRGCSPTRETFWLVFKRSAGHSRISRLC